MWSRMRSTHRSRNIARSSNPTESKTSSASATSAMAASADIPTTTPPPQRSRAGCAPKGRRSSPRGSRGFWQSISSIRMTSCMSIQTCRIRTCRARHPRMRSFDRPTTRSTTRPGTTCRCRPRVASLSTRPDARRGSRSTRISRIFWSARGRARTGAGVSCATIITTASATATGRSSPCSTRSSRSARIKNTIVVFSADHGELGGNHQMRGKGNCAYRQQNHVPLMIVHPAYPGGLQCRAVDLADRPAADDARAHRRAG